MFRRAIPEFSRTGGGIVSDFFGARSKTFLIFSGAERTGLGVSPRAFSKNAGRHAENRARAWLTTRYACCVFLPSRLCRVLCRMPARIPIAPLGSSLGKILARACGSARKNLIGKIFVARFFLGTLPHSCPQFSIDRHGKIIGGWLVVGSEFLAVPVILSSDFSRTLSDFRDGRADSRARIFRDGRYGTSVQTRRPILLFQDHKAIGHS